MGRRVRGWTPVLAMACAVAACSGGMGVADLASGTWNCASTPAAEEFSSEPLSAELTIDGSDFSITYSDESTAGETETTKGTWKTVGDKVQLVYTGHDGKPDDRFLSVGGPLEFEDGQLFKDVRFVDKPDMTFSAAVKVVSVDEVAFIGDEDGVVFVSCKRKG